MTPEDVETLEVGDRVRYEALVGKRLFRFTGKVEEAGPMRQGYKAIPGLFWAKVRWAKVRRNWLREFSMLRTEGSTVSLDRVRITRRAEPTAPEPKARKPLARNTKRKKRDA